MSSNTPVTADPALAPWLQDQLQSLLSQRGHAWLLSGPSGLGQFELALALARAWLCEAPMPQGACGHCGSCHAVDVHTHADLCMLMPETLFLDLGWPLDQKTQEELDAKKRKPSKEIKVDAAREAVSFTQFTRSRGDTKVVLVFPAERMNTITANTLLKTLEEPPGDVKFVLASEAAHQLLPTIRSRCLIHTMAWPNHQEAEAWLTQHGFSAEEATFALRTAGGRPDEVFRQKELGQTMQWWAQFPRAMQAGDASYCSNLPPSEVIDALQKLCHDLMMRQAEASLRYFNASDLPSIQSNGANLTAWFKRLSQAARSSEHPFNAGLMLEALCSEAREVINAT